MIVAKIKRNFNRKTGSEKYKIKIFSIIKLFIYIFIYNNRPRKNNNKNHIKLFMSIIIQKYECFYIAYLKQNVQKFII